MSDGWVQTDRVRLCRMGLPILFVFTISGCRGAPKIVETVPADGSQVSATSWIGIQFEMEMDRASVETNWQLSPPVEGNFRWEDLLVWFIPSRPFNPGETYTVTLGAGAQSATGREVRATTQWTFTVREPSLLYLSPVNGPAALWQIDLGGKVPPEEIPFEVEGELLDYAVNRDGSALIYVLANIEGGSDLYLGKRDAFQPILLINCGANKCSNPVWAPSGRRVAFGRAKASADSVSGFDPPRLWTVDTRTRSAAELISDDHVLLGAASWSPDEQHLAFYDRTLDSIRILNLATSEEQVLPTAQGLMGSWSPDGTQMVFPVLESGDEEFVVTLLGVDLATRESWVILGPSAGWREIGQPQWSPNGEWIAVGLQDGAGRQLWLVRPDGSEIKPVDPDPNYTYGGVRWDPWGESMVYQRYPLGATILDGEGETSEVYTWSLVQGTGHLLASNAWKPDWLP